VILWFVPGPQGVEPAAWHLFAIFVATIVGIIAKPLPMGAVALLGITATVLTGTLTLAQGLSGFSNSTIWVVVIAFFISRGFLKTGLGRRIAYLFVAGLGRNSLGLGYGLAATDLVLAPGVASITARGGGIVYPVLLSISKVYGSEPNSPSARKIGAFLTQCAYQANCITAAMFITAMAANPLAVELAGGMGITITWTSWALAALVPGLLSLIVVPLVLYYVYPPEIKRTEAATDLAREELSRMGQMKRSEWMLLAIMAFLLILWIFGGRVNIDATTAAFAGLALLLLSGVLTWKDVTGEHEAWNTLTWFAGLVMMASFLNSMGLTTWFSEAVGARIAGWSWVPAFLGLSLIYFYSHYFFASNTAHIASMYAAFLAVALVVGAPPLLAALVLGFFSSLFASLTHYAAGPAPIFFGSGYVELGKWWQLGLLVSVVNIVIWLGVGSVWWKILGLW